VRRALLVALAALVFPASAFAHATLESTKPGFRQELQAGPAQIRLHFDQQVRLIAHPIQVLNEKGMNFALPARTQGTDIVAAVKRLPRGQYTVRWQAMSADTHVVSGVWTFGVGVPAATVEEAYGAGGPTTQEDVVRWLWFLGMALTIGALGFRLIVLRGLDVPQAGSAPSSRCRRGSPRSRCARRTRCSCRSGGSSTATSPRWRRRASARRS
jgi:copper transport protein